MTTLQKFIEQSLELKDRMKRDGKTALTSALSSFFLAHPEAAAIVWVQYTPHFNDGDACTFGVNEFELKLQGDELDYGYGEKCAVSKRNPRYGDASLPPLAESLVNDYKSLIAALNKIPEVLEMVLGDHARVTATPAGIDVDEHDHD